MAEAPGDGETERLGAVVLTGGSGSRMGGVDKASIEVDGVTLLERALAATMTAVEVVVVGEQVPTSRPVTWTREDPRGGGPAAGLLAGLDRFLRPPDLVAVLAVDMPRVGPGTFARLVGALSPSYDGALLVGPDGTRQPLCGVYRWASLQQARPDAEHEHGLPVHRLLSTLTLVELPAVAGEADDVDTWTDLKVLRESANGEPDGLRGGG
jgi:molybdopterin-guanine dinucleotide biosynthesis protein A